MAKANNSNKRVESRLRVPRRLSGAAALIDDNTGHVNVVVCEADYRALKRGIEHLPPPTQ